MLEDRYYQPEIEAAPRECLHAVQGARLAAMVENCYANVPFYREKLDAMGLLPGDIKTIGDIAKLPFTTKQDLRDTYPYGMFAVPKERLARIQATSGTTGRQTVVGLPVVPEEACRRTTSRWGTANSPKG